MSGIPHVDPHLLREFQSPALIVDLDRVRANLARMLRYVEGDPGRWRPHVKTVKIPAVFRELAGVGVRHFKCATTREAVELINALAESGLADPDVLCAYPLIGPALERLGVIAREHPNARVSVLAEDSSAVSAIPAALGVFVDVNPGMHRTGLPLADRAGILAVARAAGGRLRGLHFYDGHLHAFSDAERAPAAADVYGELMELLAAFDTEGITVPEVVTSGTPSFRHALAYEPLSALAPAQHRISPGTVVYHDLCSEEANDELGLVPAALVFSRIISHPAADIATADAGSKSLAAEAGDPCAAALDHPGLRALTPSEEHLPFRVEHGPRPERGSGLLLVPRHVCPTVNLAEEAVLVENGVVREIVSVTARAHELRGPRSS